VVIEGCVGECASCHSLYPYEAKEILGKKFDVKEIISIAVKRGYFEVIYKNSKGKEEKINLLFSKDKACKELILHLFFLTSRFFLFVCQNQRYQKTKKP